MKCACGHRLERHEILASGKVICTDCKCRDYVAAAAHLAPIELGNPVSVDLEFTTEELLGPLRDDWWTDRFAASGYKLRFIDDHPEDAA